MGKLVTKSGRKRVWTKKGIFGTAGLGAVLIYGVFFVYGLFMPLPEGVSYEGGVHTGEAEFLADHTFAGEDGAEHDHVIFDKIHTMIDEAEQFILIDMFLFNDEYDRASEFPEVSGSLIEALTEKKEANPDMEIIVITDPINTFYGSYESEGFAALEEAGVRVVMTDLTDLRDSNPVFSAFWRAVPQWLGNKEGGGWLPNPFSPDSPDGTVRSYLKLLNFKANHRKVVVTEQEGMVTSANPHDASGLHSNVAMVINGPVLQDLVESEKAVALMSGADEEWFAGFEIDERDVADEGSGDQIQLVTEGKIKKHLLDEMALAGEGDTVYLGAFYLSERDVIQGLLDAGSRGADVRVILDANKDAFGREKNGVPNRPVAHELIAEWESGVEVRWYNTSGEQYHTKMVLVDRGEEAAVIAGSANFTRRNLDDLNLETNVKITGGENSETLADVRAYFDRLWFNEGAEYTHDYNAYKDSARTSRWLYRFQEWSGLSTF
ncbi:phospholipase [Alteribacter lacisalsi]|uniref:phospholipase D n=1 Tax=Alteribacter lacisalsi TaxID=2045244 RepID=A0A2W0H913_9BACI|nr:phospholipase D family protein [Alteribacter lacisalsi]PYZ97421.1 phospholipase [Alteribacter lacisalsi]